jgi:Icc-related predicted phosphoesterase
MKAIKLPNRVTETKLYYSHKEGDFYIFRNDDSWIWHYCKTMLDKVDGHPIGIDPEGGPFMMPGYKIKNMIFDHLGYDEELKKWVFYMKKKTSYKICAMSDIHGHLPENIEECDIVCIAGDIMPLEIQRNVTESFMWFKEIFFPWINDLPCEKVFWIGGNHDFWLSWTDTKAVNRFTRENCYDKLVYLNNTLVEYDNLRSYGCPQVENLEGWAFYTEDGHEFNAIPQCDILLTHMPPKIENLGYIPKYGDLGSEELKHIADSHKIKLWFCGHMHDGNHEIVEYNGCKLKNVAIKNDLYEVANPITYIDLEI